MSETKGGGVWQMLTLVIAYKKVFINLVPNSDGLKAMVFFFFLFFEKFKIIIPN